jgi:cobalt/nickel transport protein
LKLTKALRLTFGIIAVLGTPGFAQAHFQELIPSTEIVTQDTGRELGLELRLTHPMSGGPIMKMGPPRQFGVLTLQGKEDLMAQLMPNTSNEQRTFQANYTTKRPGDLVFYLEPAPYWEPAEGVMIIHYTKTVVSAFGGTENWQAEVGFPVEITPLARPYGLWTGNLFTGIVKKDDQPVPFAEVEVEWRNDGSVAVPADPFATQVIKAGANGVFSYAMPRGGWWGFAALLEGDSTMENPEGQMVPVETGALIWVRTRDMN